MILKLNSVSTYYLPLQTGTSQKTVMVEQPEPAYETPDREEGKTGKKIREKIEMKNEIKL